MRISRSLLFTGLIAYLFGYLFSAINSSDVLTEGTGIVLAVVVAVLFWEASERWTDR